MTSFNNIFFSKIRAMISVYPPHYLWLIQLLIHSLESTLNGGLTKPVLMWRVWVSNYIPSCMWMYPSITSHRYHNILDGKDHGANMGPIWGRQVPGGPHVGPMNFAIWDYDASDAELLASKAVSHDDVIQWKHFPRYWPFVRGIHWSPVNSHQKDHWCGALIFSLI